MKQRCPWAETNELDAAYHDDEWGVPSFDDRHLFELLTLEGAQAGLSWSLILRKRPGYRTAFANFDPQRVARFSSQTVERLLQDPSIVRHRGKIEATIANARAVLELREAGRSLSDLLWQFVDVRPRQNRWRRQADVPAMSAESHAMSKVLKQQGFRFVGPTTCYALMQAAGMVNDHLTGCFRHADLAN